MTTESSAVKRRKRPRAPGPFSRAIDKIDRRGAAGRLLKEVQASLVEHVGGDPSPAEMLLIQSASLKVVRLQLMGEQLLAGDPVNADHNSILAWSNGLRLDLCALGLKRQIKNVSQGMLADHFSKPPSSRA